LRSENLEERFFFRGERREERGERIASEPLSRLPKGEKTEALNTFLSPLSSLLSPLKNLL